MFGNIGRVAHIGNIDVAVGVACGRNRRGSCAGGVTGNTGGVVAGNVVATGIRAGSADGDAVAGGAAIAGSPPDRGGYTTGTVDVGVAGGGGAGTGVGTGGVLGNVGRVTGGDVNVAIGMAG